MELNGKTPDKTEFFGDIDFSKLPETLEEESEIGDFKEVNLVSHIPERFKDSTFNDVDSELAEKLKDFALKDSDRIFLLFGESGLGKSTSLSAAIHERSLKNLGAGLYFSIRFLMPVLRSCRSFSSQENELQFYNRICTVPFLCLDEVGTCPVTSEEREFLSTVFATRYDNMLPTFAATNLSPLDFKGLITGVDVNISDSVLRKELSQKMDKEYAILNRIKSVAITHTLTGESYRTRSLYV